eukprot:m.206251 g.206251  ORF g.206251 m.206251 type:complete len:287 (-) comp17101_c0_seq2:82-942(-)
MLRYLYALLAATVLCSSLEPRNERQVYYVHVHKAGGTSMCKTAQERNEVLPTPHWNCNGKGDDVIARNGPGGLFNKDWSCESRLDHNRKANVTYFQTETIFHPHNMACKDEFQYVITFRDPWKRLISHVRFEAQFMKPGMGMPHFRNSTFSTVASPETKRGTPVVDNYYIRTLLDYDTFKAQVGTIGKPQLDKAKWLLDNFVVLILEEPEDMALLMECYLGWPRKQAEDGEDVKHVNRTPGDLQAFVNSRMDPAWVEELKRLNAGDDALYEYAKQVSKRQVEQCRG